MNQLLSKEQSNYHNHRYFKNPLLEKLAYTSLLTVNVIFIPIIIFFAYLSFTKQTFIGTSIGIFIGLFLWTFIEYFTHRFAFHFKFNNKKLKWFHAILHLSHHQFVHDKRKYQTLLLISLPTSILIYYFLKIIFGIYVEPIFTGFIMGYVLYEFTHYSTHKMKMDYIFLRQVKQHHMHHHFLNQEKNFGVTSAFWDIVFKTRLTRHDKVRLLHKKAQSKQIS